MMDRSADFLARRNGPGVFRSFDFDTLASLGKRIGLAGGNWLNLPCATMCGSDGVFPSLDPDVKASGVSSMRFDIPGQHGGNFGLWSTRFSDDNLRQIRAGQTLWAQWAHRIDGPLANTFFFEGGSGGSSGPGAFQPTLPITAAAYVDATTFEVAGDQRAKFATNYALRTFRGSDLTLAPYVTTAYGLVAGATFDAANNRTRVSVYIRNGGDPGAAIPMHSALDGVQVVASGYGQGGFKVVDITQGARGTQDASSSSNVKLVNVLNNRNVPVLYQSNSDAGLYEVVNGKTLLQNAIATSIYGAPAVPKDAKTYPGCLGGVPDVWMTTTARIDLLALVVNAAGTHAAWDWRLRYWTQFEDDPPTLVWDWDSIALALRHPNSAPGSFRLNADNPAFNYGLGKLNAFPYFTNKAFDQHHATGHAWYDEITLSLQPIPFVGASRVVVAVPPTSTAGDPMGTPTQQQLDQAVADCKTAYNSASVAAGSPSLDAQIASAASAATAAQLAADQAAITTATGALSTLQAAVKAKAATLAQDAAVDAQHVSDLQALVP